MNDKVINIDIASLKSKLAWGDMTRIAAKMETRRTPQSISQQLSGKTKSVSPEIISVALKVIDEREKEVSKLNKRINK